MNFSRLNIKVLVVATMAVATMFGVLTNKARASEESHLRALNQQYERVSGQEAMKRSAGHLVLYKGEAVRNIEGVVEFLEEQGVPVVVVMARKEKNIVVPNDNEIIVIANRKVGGAITQTEIDRGAAADILLFARNSGVPIR